jgi:hypothetical protein
MKIRVPGEKTKVACEKCQAFQSGTWKYGPLTMDDGTIIEQVMIAYCDVCQEPCSMATQSAWKLKEAREAKSHPRTSVMVSLPLLDLAAGKVSEVGGEPKRGPELLTKAILRRLSKKPKSVPIFAKYLKTIDSPLLQNSSKRMNLSLTPAFSQVLGQLKKATSLNQSEVIRRALIASESDPAFSKELKKMLDADMG